MEGATWSFSQTFTSGFQSLRSDLESQIEAVELKGSPSPDTIQELSTSLAKLVKALVDATGSLPSYDQKLFEGQVKALETSIESLRTSAPKAKFSFRRKVPIAQPASTPSPSTSILKTTTPSSNTSSSNNVALSNLSHQYLSYKSLGNANLPTDLTLSDLSTCIIDLLPPLTGEVPTQERLRLTALHVRNLKDCVLLLPIIEGSALLHDLSRCTVVLGSHQFRMHTSNYVDVFLDIGSNPVIEHCQGVRFGSYPTKWTSFTSAQGSHQKAFSVQDFSHIRATPSPNFTMLSDEEAEVVLEKLATKLSACSEKNIVDTSSVLPPI